jgi:hypothetical protein
MLEIVLGLASRINLPCRFSVFVGWNVGDAVTSPMPVFAEVFILRGLRGALCGSVDSARDRRDVVVVARVDGSAQTRR